MKAKLLILENENIFLLCTEMQDTDRFPIVIEHVTERKKKLSKHQDSLTKSPGLVWNYLLALQCFIVFIHGECLNLHIMVNSLNSLCCLLLLSNPLLFWEITVVFGKPFPWDSCLCRYLDFADWCILLDSYRIEHLQSGKKTIVNHVPRTYSYWVSDHFCVG